MNKNIVYVTLLLGLGGYFAYDTYYPEYVKWESEIEELQKKIDTAKQNAPKLADLRKDEQQLKSRLRASLAQLPSGAELTDLMVMVMPLLEECGISSSRITQKSVDNPQLQQVYRVHPIKISGIKDLSMQTIIEVMHKIREFKRIINAKSVRMQRTGPDRYTLDMDLETYSYIETEGEDLGLEGADADDAMEDLAGKLVAHLFAHRPFGATFQPGGGGIGLHVGDGLEVEHDELQLSALVRNKRSPI